MGAILGDVSFGGRWAHGLLFAVLAASPRMASGAPAPAPATQPIADSLHVEPDGCVTREALSHAIGSWLQREVIDGSIRFDVRTEGTTAIFVTTRGGVVAGERRLPTGGGTCTDIIDALALAIALTIDASMLDRLGLAAARPPTPPPVAPPPAPPPSVALPPAASPPADRPSASALRLGVEAFGTVLFDVLPDVVAGGGAGFDASLGPKVDVRVTGLGAGTSTTGLGSGGGNLKVDLAGGRLDGCVAPWQVRFRPRACIGVAAGAAFGRGEGYMPSFSATAWWAALSARVDASVSLGHTWALVAGVDVLFDLLRPRFDVGSPSGGISAVERLPAIGAALTLGPSLLFW